MTLSSFLCRVCTGFVQGCVRGLTEWKSLYFQAFSRFVHGVQGLVYTYACTCAHARIHAHTCARMCIHKLCTPCTSSIFYLKTTE